MDVPKEGQFIQNGKISAADKAVSQLNHEVNPKCTCNEDVIENRKDLGNHMTIEASNENPSCEPKDPNRNMSSAKKTISDHEHEMDEIRSSVCDPVGLQKLGHLPDDASKCSNLEQFNATQKDESEKLSQPGKKKRGRPRKSESMFTGSPRALRSRSQEKSRTPESVNAPTQDVGSQEKNRRKKKKRMKEIPNNEFSWIRTHLRYLLNRMNYEQNFIDAYAGEGWKGQSLEKIRPEKELERAKSNILRYKLKIRDLFQRIDTSCEEGRIPESLFDSEGLIDSEDIFCAKCGLKDVQIDNDIILCDGACERGFHQFCLDPPLLKEQVPPGDEGWLCPACDCKIDCTNLLNDSRGTDLSISDSWEKVFPEAATTGNKLDDISGLPSDDSEDDDYNPDGPEMDEEVDEEESISDGSDFSSASEDLGTVANNEQYLGLPSEDSDDDDYDPDRVGADEQAKLVESSSDFTSDSEELSELYKEEGPLAEAQEPSMSCLVENNEEISKGGMVDGGSTPITAKRHVERLDYKKLYDETYGNESSDSSDEDFTDTDAPRRRKNTKGVKDTDTNQNQKQSESTPKRRTRKKINVEGTGSSSASGSSSRRASKSANRRLGEAATQRLHETFKVNQYPDRGMIENLAKDLNLSVIQVRKWFENARWSFNHPGKRNQAGKPPFGSSTSMIACNGVEKQLEEATPEKLVTMRVNKESSVTPKSRKREAKAADDDADITPSMKEASPVDTSKSHVVRRSGRIQSKGAEKSPS